MVDAQSPRSIGPSDPVRAIRRSALLVIVLVIALTGMFAEHAIRVRIRVTEPDLLPTSHPSIATDKLLRDRFGDDRRYVLVLATDSGTVTDERVRDAYRDLCELVTADEYLGLVFVDPIDRDRFLPPEARGPDSPPWLLDRPPADYLERVLAADGLTANLHVSRSRRAFVLYLPVRGPSHEAPTLNALRQVADAFAERHPDGFQLRILGEGVVHAAFGERIEADLLRYLPWVIGLTLALFLFAFRSPLLAVLALSEVGIACTWTLGLLVLVGHQLSLLTSLIPVFLTALGVADEIHLFAEYFQRRRRKPGTPPAILALEAARCVARPVTVTSVTTAVAFLSFTLTDIPAVQTFGFMIGVGTLISWFLTLVFVPAVLVWVQPGDGPRWTDPANAPRRPVATRPLLAIVSSVFLLPGIFRLEVDDAWTRNFEPTDPVVRDARWLDEESTGLHRFDLLLEAPGDTGATWDTLPAMTKLAQLGESLAGEESVLLVLSAVDLARERAWELAGMPDDSIALPDSTSELRRVLDTFRVFNEEVFLRQFLGEDRTQARLAVFMRGDDHATAMRLHESLRRRVKDVLGPDAEPAFGGSAERGRVLIESMVETQLRAVAVSVALLFALLFIMSGNLQASVRCMAAVGWALALMLGIVGWLGLPLGVASSCFLGIALGVGIDYSVHFAFGRVPGHDHLDTQHAIARRVFCNVAVVGSALCVLMLSANPTIRTLGLLLVLSMIVSGWIAAVCLAGAGRRDPPADSVRAPTP